MRQDTAFAMVVLAIVAVLALAQVSVWVDCNARGGTTVRNMVGWPVCVYGR